MRPQTKKSRLQTNTEKINDVICKRPPKKICFAVSIKKVTTQKKISEKSQVGSDSFLFFLATSNKKKA